MHANALGTDCDTALVKASICFLVRASGGTTVRKSGGETGIENGVEKARITVWKKPG